MRRAAAILAGLVALAGCSQRAAPPDKAAVERIVHDYILAHPEIIPEAMTAVQSRDVAGLLAHDRTEVETPFPGATAGNPKGDVTLVEFFDYACPYCRAANADVQRLIKTDPGLRVVYREVSVISPASAEAAMAGLSAARQGRFAAYHDRMFAGPGQVDHERVVATVRAAGLNERQTAADLTDPRLTAELKRNSDLGRALGLTATPTFIAGDRIVAGAVGYDRLAALIAAARRTAPRQG